MRRRQDKTSVCVVAMMKGKPMNQTSLSRLGQPETEVHARGHLRAELVCAQKKERNEMMMTGHEGREDMKRKKEACVKGEG